MTNETERPEVTLSMLKGAFAMRAAFYAHMFDVLREKYGASAAVDLMSQATVRLGEGMAEKYSEFAPADLAGLKDGFLGGIPCAAEMFAPEVKRCDEQRLEIQFHRCPLKDTWLAMGRSEEDIEMLCRAGGAIDGGLFSKAGFIFKGETWAKGRSGCCLLRVEPGPAA